MLEVQELIRVSATCRQRDQSRHSPSIKVRRTQNSDSLLERVKRSQRALTLSKTTERNWRQERYPSTVKQSRKNKCLYREAKKT